jgi:multidrug efflux pump
MSVNLSAWAIRNRTLVRYAMLVLALVGIFSYQRLGQSEDPPFTFKVMVVRTFWPGATAAEVSRSPTASKRSCWKPASMNSCARIPSRANR